MECPGSAVIAAFVGVTSATASAQTVAVTKVSVAKQTETDLEQQLHVVGIDPQLVPDVAHRAVEDRAGSFEFRRTLDSAIVAVEVLRTRSPRRN